MKRFFPLIVLIILIFFLNPAYSNKKIIKNDNTADSVKTGTVKYKKPEKTLEDKIVYRLYFVLLREYDNLKDKTFTERLAIALGRKAYVEDLSRWRDNYKNLDEIKIELNNIFEYMAKRCDKTLSKEESEYFRYLLEMLTILGYKNLQLYYLGILKYLDENNKDYYDFDLNLLGETIARYEFYYIKKEIYKIEEHTRTELGRMLNEPKLKAKLPLYAFAFNFFNKMRQNIADNDLKDILSKLNKK